MLQKFEVFTAIKNTFDIDCDNGQLNLSYSGCLNGYFYNKINPKFYIYLNEGKDDLILGYCYDGGFDKNCCRVVKGGFLHLIKLDEAFKIVFYTKDDGSDYTKLSPLSYIDAKNKIYNEILPYFYKEVAI